MPRSQHCSATNTPDPAVLDWISALCRARINGTDEAARDLTVTFDEDEWDKAAAMLRANRLWSLASQHALECAPHQLQRRQAQQSSRARLHNLQVLATLGKVAPCLAKAGIDALVIKGPLQQDRVFGTPFERAATDADLWVHAGQRAAAATVLIAAGYREYAECSSPWWRVFLGEAHFAPPNPGLSEVDLHHRLGQAGLPMPAKPELFFEQSRQDSPYSASARLPSPQHAFLITCLALIKGVVAGEPVGHYALEVAMTSRRADRHLAALILSAAREQRMERIVALALALSGKTFAVDLNLPGFARIEAPDAARYMILARQPVWSRRRLVWAACGGAWPLRVARFANAYKAFGVSQACRLLLHRPDQQRAVTDGMPPQRGEPCSEFENPNPA